MSTGRLKMLNININILYSGVGTYVIGETIATKFL